MRARAEAFGAWVRVDDGTLVAVDREAARRLGVDGGALWSAPPCAPADVETSRPIEVHLAVTSRCAAGCTGCYLDATPDGEAPPLDELIARLRAVAEAGAFTVAFGGGEPLSRPDLGRLADEARALGLTPVVTTSGLGLTRARAAQLRGFAQANVSYDGIGEDYEAVRGFDGAEIAERAMARLCDAGVPFGVNVVLTRSSFSRVAATVARAEALGAREVQLLRYKPAGRARDASYLATRLSTDQVDALYPLVEALTRQHRFAIRIDCALVPLLASRPLDPAVLVRFGVFGCEAARHLGALRVDGRAAPCSFGPPSRDAGGPDLSEAWRRAPMAEPCRSCDLRTVCRGGCRVVALHLDGELGPDPECPRVRAHRKEHPSDGGAV
jgi:radical SAM protein with 4Fe4S-binding SPASM domain